MNTEEKIAVMQAYLEGKEIEIYNFDSWEKYTSGEPLWNWDDYTYRIKPELEYVPFDFTDAKKLISEIVQYKSTEALSVITNVNSRSLTISRSNVTYKELFEKYTFVDGSVCGKLK